MALLDILEALAALPVPLALLLATGVALRRRPAGRALVGVAAAGLLALCLPATAALLARPLAGGAPAELPAGSPPPDAVLVPTGGIYSDGAGAWLPSASSVRRARLGAQLSRTHGVPLIVAGGATAADGPAEATVVARLLGSVPALHLETTARDTAETAAAVAAIAARQDIRRLAVVTGRLHLRRMTTALRSAGLDVVLAATPDAPSLITPRSFLPSGAGFALSTAAWREYLGIAWYGLTGRISATAL